MKFIIKLFVVLLVIIILVPIIAYKSIFSGSPRDLGIKYTPADYTSTHQKFGVEVDKLTSAATPKDSLQYTGSKEVNVSLNSSEISAYTNSDTWIYTPITHLQFKINPDGTGEVSGLLNVKNALAYVSLTTPIEEVEKAVDQFHIPSSTPFYTKGTVTVINNQVNFNLQSLEIGHIPVPANYLSENIGAINNYATDRLNSIPNLHIRSLTLTGGQANLDATVPDKVSKLEK